MDNIPNPNFASFLCGFRKLKLTRVHLHLPCLSQLQGRCRNNESLCHLIAKIQQCLSYPTVYFFFFFYPCKRIENQSWRCTIISFSCLASLSPCLHGVSQKSWCKSTSMEMHTCRSVSIPKANGSEVARSVLWGDKHQCCFTPETAPQQAFESVMSVLWLSPFSLPLLP